MIRPARPQRRWLSALLTASSTALGAAALFGVAMGPVAVTDALLNPAEAAPLRTKEVKKGPEKVQTVRYSYEAWSRAGSKRYVLVPRPTEVTEGNLPVRVRALFAQLVGDKRGSYGGARLAFKDDADKTGDVYVYLDSSKSDYDPIVMAETVYTFTENGASRVIFPKKADDGWTRANVPYPAYVLSVPLYQALPPSTLTSVLVELPDGSLLTRAEAIARLEKGDKAMVGHMWAGLKTGGDKALAAVKAAPLLKLKDLDDRLLPVLKMADARLRKAAMEGLTGRDNDKVNAAIRKIMDGDRDEALRDVAAGVLSNSKDPRYSTAAQYHALRSKDPQVVAKAATALGESKQKEAGQQLLDILSHKEQPVRGAAIASLQKRGDSGALAKRLDDKKLDASIKLEIARALAEGADKGSVHVALMHLAVNGKENDSASAAEALGSLDKPATYPALGAALKHAEPATRLAAAAALKKLAKPAGLKVLAEADVADKDSGAAVQDTIRSIYAGQKLDFVLKGVDEKRSSLRQAAVATLGDIVQRDGNKVRNKVLGVLRKLAKDKEAPIRAAAARSFGIMKGDDIKPDLMGMTKDSAVEVKRASAAALAAFPGDDSIKVLMGYVTDADAEVKANALQSLGALKARPGLSLAAEARKDKSAEVRRSAAYALVQIGGTLSGKEQQAMLSYYNELVFDADASVRLKAVDGFRQVQDGGAVSTALAPLVQDPEPEVRKATLMVVAGTNHPSAVEVIATALEDDNPEMRRAALEAFKVLKRKEAVATLTEYAGKEADKTLKDEAQKVISVLKGS